MLLLTYAALTCKFLIPVGYMPAALSDGLFVRMCHSGLPESLFTDGGDHREHNNTDELRWENCSLGALASAVAIASEHGFQVRHLNETEMPVAYVRNSIDTTEVVFHSRAPPTSII